MDSFGISLEELRAAAAAAQQRGNGSQNRGGSNEYNNNSSGLADRSSTTAALPWLPSSVAAAMRASMEEGRTQVGSAMLSRVFACAPQRNAASEYARSASSSSSEQGSLDALIPSSLQSLVPSLLNRREEILANLRSSAGLGTSNQAGAERLFGSGTSASVGGALQGVLLRRSQAESLLAPAPAAAANREASANSASHQYEQLMELQALRLRAAAGLVSVGGVRLGGGNLLLSDRVTLLNVSQAQQLVELEVLRRQASILSSLSSRNENRDPGSSVPGASGAASLPSQVSGLCAGTSALQGHLPLARLKKDSDDSGNLSEQDREKLATLENLGRLSNQKMQLPPMEEGDTPHYSQRLVVPLGIEEDPNWLSERQCFIRAELLEVIRASQEEVLVRSSSKSIAYQQVGIRCRYCAHLQPSSRAIRSSAFPSSIRQIYQSFTMMVRDHFGSCEGVPQDKKEKFIQLKGLTSPSSSLSRQYWTFAAKKLGMVDSECGIVINEETQADAQKIPPFGTTEEETASVKAAEVKELLEPNDARCISPYLYMLVAQTQVVYLLPSERVGKRKDAAVGLPGFGCRYCAQDGRLGFCRMFPLNKRSLPDKVNDLFNHLVRCPRCPSMTKRWLESRRTEQESNRSFVDRDREFIDRIWYKLGRDTDEAFKKS